MSDSGLFKKIRDFHDKYIDNKFVRFLLLIGAGGLGLLFGKLVDVQFFRDCLGLHETVAEYLATAVVGIFVFIFLWYFRTRDVRQQIEKTQEQIDKFQIQIQQNYFSGAIENLTSSSLLKGDIGIKLLIKLSETTPEFSELITIAFENRIKELTQDLRELEHKAIRDSMKDNEIRQGMKDNEVQRIRKHYEIQRIQSTKEPKYIYRQKLIKDMKGWLSDHKRAQEKRDDKSLR